MGSEDVSTLKHIFTWPPHNTIKLHYLFTIFLAHVCIYNLFSIFVCRTSELCLPYYIPQNQGCGV